MMTLESVRKAGLLASLMDSKQRKQLLASLPVDAAVRLSHTIRDIEQQGWARREVVELALADRVPQATEHNGFALDELMLLSIRMDCVHFARILTASQPSNPTFVLSMLDASFAESVRACIDALPVMPERLRMAVCAYARFLLDDSRPKALV